MIAQEILLNALNAMPNKFGSNAFYRELRKAQVPNKILAGSFVTEYLKKVANQPYFGARTWEKRQPIRLKPPQSNIQFTPNTPEPIIYNHEYTEQEAIAFLKERGYKIFKYTEL